MRMDKKKFSNTMRIDLIPDVCAEPVAGKAEVIVSSAPPERPERSASELGSPEEENSRYHDLLESIYDAVVITDLSGCIVDVNGRAVEFLKYPASCLQGVFIGEVVSGATAELVATLLENLNDERFTLIQAFCARRDGSMFPSEIAVSYLRFGEGQLCFFVRDITVRRQAEEMLRTEHNALQNAGTGIGIANLSMAFEYVNPALARMLGYADSRDVVSSHIDALIRDEATTQALRSAIVNAQTDWTGEVMLLRADGGPLSAQVAAACNRSADGEVIGFVFSFVDLTDRHQAERAMRDAERHRVMLESLGAACHHLGQPATVLTANLGLIRGRLDCDDTLVSGLVDSSLGACEKLADILHKMNAVAEYRTTEYLAGDDSTESAERILQL